MEDKSLHEHDTEALQRELEEFKAEKEKIRMLVGQIGGVRSAERDRIINLVFLTLIGILFVFDIFRHLFQITVLLPPLFSLELGILLVSIKIVWMIHKQTKVEHFQFWILNSIEFRLNELSKQLRENQKRKEN